jgi:hypothetical protein
MSIRAPNYAGSADFIIWKLRESRKLDLLHLNHLVFDYIDAEDTDSNMPTTVRYLVGKDRPNGNQSVEDLYTRKEIEKRPILWNQYTREYLVFDSRQELFSWYDTISDPNRHYHEVIFGFLPQHLHFDIDALAYKLETIPVVSENDAFLDELFGDDDDALGASSASSAPAAAVAMINQIIEAILDELYSSYYCLEDLMPTRDDIIVTDSSGATATGFKYSYHIVTTYAVANNEEAKQFMFRVLERIPMIYHEFIDQTVYKRTQNFRLLGSAKPGTSRFKRITDTFGTLSKTSFEQTMIVAAPTEPILPKLELDAAATSSPIVTVQSDVIQAVLAVVTNDGAMLGHSFTEARGLLLCFARIAPSYCKICKEIHHNDNSLMINIIPESTPVGSTETTCRIVEYCRQARKKHRVIGEIALYLGALQVPTMRAPDRADIMDTITARIGAIHEGKVNPHNALSSAFEQLPDEQKTYELVPTLAVLAQMKLGKTKAMRAYLAQHFSPDGLGANVIRFVTFRQTFSNSIANDFPDFALYSGIVGDIDHIQYPRVIIQVESLYRLKIDVQEEPIDLLVLDEAESIFAQFNSGLHKHFNASFAAFQWMLQTARHVVCMDANLGDRTYNTLMRLRTAHPIHFHWNRFARAADDKYYFTSHQGSWLGQLYTALRSNKNIVMPTNSLAEARAYEEAIKREFPKKKVMLYSSETAQSEKVRHFADVHTYWKDLDVLIFTPTCSAGVSFELEHFDMLFGFFCDQSCDVETCRQMLGRVRRLRTGEHYICLSGTKAQLPETTAEISRLLRNKRASYYRNINDPAVQFEYTADGDIQFYESNYYYLWLETVRINNLSRNNFIHRFIDQVADTGALINVLTKDESEVGAALLTTHRETRDELKEARCAAVAEADVISPEEASQIRDALSAPVGQPDVEPEMRLAYDKFQLCETYNWHDRPIDATFVRQYQDYSTRRVYRNLQQITMCRTIRESLQQIKAQEANQYSYVMETRTCINESRDLVKDKQIYTFRSHFIAVWLLEICGFQCITDQSRIHETTLETRIRAAIPLFRRAMDGIIFEFETQRPDLDKLSRELDRSRFIASALRFVNAILRIMYGIQIRKIPKRNGGGAYQLCQSTVGKLFVFSEQPDTCPHINSRIVPLSSKNVRVNAFLDDVVANASPADTALVDTVESE